jgi:hypothetical protein
MYKVFLEKNLAPICRKCIYYKPSRYDKPNTENLGVCRKYAYQCKVTGKIVYDYAILVREDYDKCGPYGYDFTQKSK